jgi:predicted transcriptional regulator
MSLKDMQSIINMPNITADALLRCALGIRVTEIETYCMLLNETPLNVQEVAQRIGKSRSNVQRLLQNLVEKGLATRQEELMGLGGYKYYYSAVSPEKMKEAITERLEEWYQRMLHELEDLPQKIKELRIKCMSNSITRNQ